MRSPHRAEAEYLQEFDHADLRMPKPPTWAALVAAEPRLGALLAEARRVSARGKPDFCANAVWYGWGNHRGFKPRLIHLVGFWAEGADPILHTGAAYDIAYQRIYRALPDCRHG